MNVRAITSPIADIASTFSPLVAAECFQLGFASGWPADEPASAAYAISFPSLPFWGLQAGTPLVRQRFFGCWSGYGQMPAYQYKYVLDRQGRRCMAGLTFEETTEFELLEAQLLMYSAELRWLELFNKHERARQDAA